MEVDTDLADVSRLAVSQDLDTRHRAFTLAERTGHAANVDRVASWMLDLEQVTSCDERRDAITKLAGTGDRRALPPLRKAKANTCVEGDASSAIQRISKSPAGR